MKNQISNQDKFYSHLYDFFSRYFGDYHLPFVKNCLVDNDEYGKIYNKSDVKLYFKTENLIYVGLSKSEIEKISKESTIPIHEIRKKLFKEIKQEIKNEIERYCNSDAKELIEKIEPTEDKPKEQYFFIHKNAKQFIEGRVKSYLTEYFWGTEGTNFSPENIYMMQEIQSCILDIANKIDAVENEIRKIWNKPKIPFTCNYVICLSKLNEATRKEIFDNIFETENHPQLQEWKKLFEKRIENFERENLEKLPHLPIDTKNFDENLKYKILSSIENIEEETNGVLINGDNWQALNSIKEKYSGSVKSIYIDPPYNTGNDGFAYLDNYSSSTWLTMMRDRLELAREFLTNDGVIFVSIDDNEQARLKLLMDEIFGEENFVNSIAVKSSSASGTKMTHKEKTIIKTKEYILCYKKSDISEDIFNPIFIKRDTYDDISYAYFVDDERKNIFPLKEKLLEGKVVYKIQKKVFYYNESFLNDAEYLKYGKIFDYDVEDENFKKFYLKYQNNIAQKSSIKNKDVVEESERSKDQIIKSGDHFVINGRQLSFLSRQIINDELIVYMFDFYHDINFSHTYLEGCVSFPAAKKPEALLNRLISLKKENDLILDFFLGSGTTSSVAHKMNRQYIGIEIDENTFDEVAIPRMKHVLFGEEGGISKDIDWQGGGMFKYYKLENFVFDSLHKCEVVEKNSGEIDHDKSSLFLEYGLNFQEEIDGTKPIIEFKKLYKNADVMEAISNLGYKIKKINSKNSATFLYEDDEEEKELTIKNLDEINLIDENLPEKLKKEILKYFAWE